jgi:transcriptional regulator with XRE-family HTH domain
MLAGSQLERRIRAAMGAADIRSLSELARRSRVQRDTLYMWFRGDHPPKPETLAKVANALGVGLADLWDYAPPTEDVTLTSLAAELREWRTQQDARQVAMLETLGTIRVLFEAWLGAQSGAPAEAPAPKLSTHRGR